MPLSRTPILRRARAAALLLALTPLGARAASCTVNAGTLDFGAYLPFSAVPTDVTGLVTVRCSAPLADVAGYQITLGAGGGGTFAGRRLAQGALTLGYQLYADVLRTSVWGDGTGGSVTVSGSLVLVAGIPGQQGHSIHARIPARQNVASGAYGDTILVTLTY